MNLTLSYCSHSGILHITKLSRRHNPQHSIVCHLSFSIPRSSRSAPSNLQFYAFPLCCLHDVGANLNNTQLRINNRAQTTTHLCIWCHINGQKPI